jgi:NAD(P)-dependent dehydrogenase (short-subunit alcohol dehydrogenase family)
MHAQLDSYPANGLAVVVGATGGIGRAVADALDASEQFAHVVRFGRSTVPPIDVTHELTIEGAARHVAEMELPLRLVFDATGFLHDEEGGPEKTWRHLDPGRLAKAFAVNATGPALLMKHFLPLLPRQGKAAFATLSARVGSIADNRIGGWYGYRASKAALNQFVRTAAIELARGRPEALAVSLHPGTVDTRLSAPFRKKGLQVRAPEEAAQLLLSVLNRLDADASGGLFDYRGEPIPF